MDDVAPKAPAVIYVPALCQHPGSIGKCVFDRIVVEQLVRLGADLPASLALGRDRPAALTPAADVEVVDKPIEEEAAVKPREAGIVVNLVGQLALPVCLRS